MTAARQVDRLRLSVGHRDQVGKASNLLQDALAIASVPLSRPGNVLVVRKLELGEISLSDSSQAAALRITEALRHARARAVFYQHPTAKAAAAVWFNDSSEVRAQLALRLVLGPPLTEWFWEMVEPDLNLGQHSEELLLRLFSPPAPAVSTDSAPVVIAARTLRQVLEHSGAPDVLRRLPASGIAGLLPGPLRQVDLRSVQHVTPRLQRMPSFWRQALAWATRDWSEGDPRITWMALCALVATEPHVAASPAAVSLVLELVTELRTAEAVGLRLVSPPQTSRQHQPAPKWRSAEEPAVAEDAPSSLTQPGTIHFESGIDAAVPAVAQSRSQQEDSMVRVSAKRQPSEGEVTEGHPSQPDSQSSPFGLFDSPNSLLLGTPAATQFAGLLFTLPMLSTLGLGEALQASPRLWEQALCWRILEGLLVGLGAEPAEPMRRALAPAIPPFEPRAESFVAPDFWWSTLCPQSGLSLHPAASGGFVISASGLPLAYLQKEPVESLGARLSGRTLKSAVPLDAEELGSAQVEAWVLAVERYCRQVLAIELARLVCRTGLVFATETHVDLVFALSNADIEVRRRGLDVNPGWVPELGRVVSFHYLDEASFAAYRERPQEGLSH